MTSNTTQDNPVERDELDKKELEKQLHKGLKETFPGSDPVTVGQPVGPKSLKDKGVVDPPTPEEAAVEKERLEKIEQKQKKQLNDAAEKAKA
jgi:hypothetical protein